MTITSARSITEGIAGILKGLFKGILKHTEGDKGGKGEFLLNELLQRALCLLVEDMINTGNY